MSLVSDFLESWPLFYTGYLASWLIAASLPLLGILLVGRNQVFLSVATAQGASLGIALGLFLAGALQLDWLGADFSLRLLAVVFAVVFTLWAAHPFPHCSQETMLGWLFLIATAAGSLLLAHSPHGAAEVNRLLTSSLIGATQEDLYLLGAFGLLVAIIFSFRWRTILLVTLDPTAAVASGIPVGRWRLIFAILIGIGIGLSIRVAGTLYVFGCLILPVTGAKLLSGSLRTLIWATPSIALLTAVFGSVLAHAQDLPPAQVAVALLAASVIIAAGATRLGIPANHSRRRRP